LFILGIIDFGSIIYEKTRLENIMSDAVTLVSNNKLPEADVEKKLEQNYNINLTLTINHRSDDTKIILRRKINIMTPGLGIAIDDPYTVEVTRVINNE
jgi:hypothetical protein